LSHPQILPQVMTVCQWLLRMWWEWDLQQHALNKPSVSYVTILYVVLSLPQYEENSDARGSCDLVD